MRHISEIIVVFLEKYLHQNSLCVCRNTAWPDQVDGSEGAVARAPQGAGGF
jgi:hypothetical protein